MDNGDAIDVLVVDPEFEDGDREALAAERPVLAVETAPTAGDAVERLETEPVDCVVAEYDLPDVDGLEVLDRVREAAPGIPFVLHTGSGSEAVASDAVGAGVTDYLPKGAGYATLADRVVRAVEDRRPGSPARDAKLRRYETLVENLPDGAYLFDSNLELVDLNRAALETIDPDREGMVGRTMSELLEARMADHESTEELLELTEQLVAGERDELRDTLEFQTTEGLKPFEGRTVRVETERGEFAGLVSVLRDISERVAVEERLRRQNERLRALFENTTAPLVEYVYRDGVPVVEAVNEAFERTFGHDADAVVGNPLGEFVVPPDGDHGASELDECARTGEYLDTEVERETPDGVRTFRVQNTPVEIGDETRGYARYTDVTERKERQRELQRYERVVENVPVGVYRTTPGEDGEIVFANRALVEILEAPSKDELLDCSPSEFYADPEKRETFSERLLDEEVVTDEVVRMHTFDGDPLWASISDRRVVIDDDVFFEGAIRDVTEREEYQRRLESRSEQLEVLNRLVRHDIRNDMEVVIGMTEVARATLDDPEVRSRLDQVLTASDHVVETTNVARDLMETMLSEDRDRTPVLVSRVLEDEVADLKSSYDRTVVQFEGDLPRVRVLADDLLGSVFRNLLKNAVQHNHADLRKITVTVEDDDDHVRVRIADNGPGIPDERKESVFGKGDRGLASEGTGIGLYLVNSLVESYEGDVWVEDRDDSADAGGSVFVVELEKAT